MMAGINALEIGLFFICYITSVIRENYIVLLCLSKEAVEVNFCKQMFVVCI